MWHAMSSRPLMISWFQFQITPQLVRFCMLLNKFRIFTHLAANGISNGVENERDIEGV